MTDMEAFVEDVWDPASVKLRCAYFHNSPEWNSLLQSVRTKYESLNSVRQEAGVSRLPWQDEVEAQLKRYHKSQRFWLRESQVEGVLWSAAPLSTQLDRFEGVNPLARERPVLGWKAMLQRWEKFRRIMRGEDGDGLLRCLPSAQRSSYEVLEDWWLSSHDDQSLVQHTRTYIESLQDVACVSSPLRLGELRKMAHETRIDESLYHASCFTLFLGEFHPMCWEPFLAEKSLTRLQGLRVQASQLSICQRQAWATVWQIQAPRRSEKGYPSPIRDTKTWFDGVTFEEKPYYLWDSFHQCTVQVDMLPDCPEYTCVSHTWGRWRKSTAAEVPGTLWAIPENELYDVRELPVMLNKLGETGATRYIWFDLFCIPQIDGDERQQIEISRQSAIFRNCKRCIAWINHCDSFAGVDMALDWLGLRFLRSTARNQEKMQNAEWLDSRLGEFDSLRWLDVELMQSQPNRPETKFGPVGWFTSLWTLQEAVLCPDLELCARDWTTLVDRQGTPISATSLMVILEQASHVCMPEVPLDAPFWDRRRYTDALGDYQDQLLANGVDGISKEPPGVSALMALASLSQLDEVLISLSPMDTLLSANCRQYTRSGDRAPAIMSALGVTDWYFDRQRDMAGQQMVCDMFPLSFIQEAARKIGGPFYGASVTPARMRSFGLDQPLSAESMADGDEETVSRVWEPVGSLLPFSKDSDETPTDIIVNHGANLHLVDHESVREWVICCDGSVVIPSAGVAAASHELGSEIGLQECGSIQVELHWFEPGNDSIFTNYDVVEDLPEKLREIATNAGVSSLVYAVTLYSDLKTQRGILLRGRQDLACENTSERLMKIGTYRATGMPMPPKVEVDWVVL